MADSAVRTGVLWTTFLALLAALGLLATTGLVGALAALVAAGLVTASVLLGPTLLGTILVFGGIFLAPMDNLRAGGFVTFSDLALFLGFALLVPRMLGQRVRPSGLHLIGSLLLLVAGALTSLANEGTAESLDYLVKMIIGVTLLPLAFLFWHPSRRQLHGLAWTYIAGQLVSTLAAPFVGMAGSRFYGLSTHPNFFGMCSLLAAALALYLVLDNPPTRRLWPILACGASLVAVVLSGSRAALLAAVVIAVVVPVLERSAKAGYLVVTTAVISVASLGLLLDSAGPGSAIGRLAGKGTAVGSDEARLEHLQHGWAVFVDNPLGGTGFRFETSLIHNGYLEVAVAWGIFGLLGYVLLLWALVRGLFAARRRSVLGYVALGYVFIGFFNNTLWDRFAWVALSMVLVWQQLQREAESPELADPVLPRQLARDGA